MLTRLYLDAATTRELVLQLDRPGSVAAIEALPTTAIAELSGLGPSDVCTAGIGKTVAMDHRVASGSRLVLSLRQPWSFDIENGDWPGGRGDGACRDADSAQPMTITVRCGDGLQVRYRIAAHA